MAIKYRASWNTSENEALIQFDFMKEDVRRQLDLAGTGNLAGE